MTDIELLRQLRSKINVEKKGWKHAYSTNCYAYAMGLDIPEYDIMPYAFCPGTISDSPIMLHKYDLFSYSDLINSIYSDLEALEITFREVSTLEDVSSDEWKIALFTIPSYNHANDYLEDFHFLRLCKDGIWRHKVGWSYYPTMYDDKKNVIRDLENCYLEDTIFNTCLSLKLKR